MFVPSYINGAQILRLSFEQFNKYRKEARLAIVVDKMGSLKASSSGISNAKGDLLCFYLGCLAFIAGAIASFLYNWFFVLIGIFGLIVLFRMSKNIRNEALIKTCIENPNVYQLAVEQNWIYVTSNDPEVIKESVANQSQMFWDAISKINKSHADSKNDESLIHSGYTNRFEDFSVDEEDEDEDEDEYVANVEKHLTCVCLQPSLDTYKENPEFIEKVQEFAQECYLTDIEVSACANCILRNVEYSEGKIEDAIKRITSDHEWVEEMFNPEDIEEFNDIYKYSPDETAYHFYFDLKCEEISQFFAANNILDCKDDRDVAAIKFIHLATCLSDATLRDNSYVTSIAYKILAVTKEKWNSSGLQYDDKGEAIGFVSYCPPYFDELQSQFGISPALAHKALECIIKIDSTDSRFDCVVDMFDETVKYAETEIALRVHKAFS